ncbi:alpha/beta fold hydrolase [Ilumatobacter nonamiensis]|uniref:alpha/beta fold hydrolase n=1 Tax=Ilumatobacter nonamiensis TaxID=467093 RepID=UPI0011D29F46|nr:alpha/beta fold hydrolase [Ilumatobacter nonamiensis]
MTADRPDRSPGLLYLLGEARAPLEAAALLPALPSLMSAPKGDGHHVVMIPPFGAGDAFTTVLRAYLGRMGYTVHKWGRSEILAFHRMHTIAVPRMREVVEEAGGPVSLIGHSLGGIYAREVARVDPDNVRRVITVGSPFAGDLKSNIVWPVYESVTGTRIASIPDDVMERLNEPLPMPTSAIYSRTDGVVSWFACIDKEAPMAENISVPGSHVGLLHNPAVLYVIADRLAQADGVHEPFAPENWTRHVASTGPWRRTKDAP